MQGRARPDLDSGVRGHPEHQDGNCPEPDLRRTSVKARGVGGGGGGRGGRGFGGWWLGGGGCVGGGVGAGGGGVGGGVGGGGWGWGGAPTPTKHTPHPHPTQTPPPRLVIGLSGGCRYRLSKTHHQWSTQHPEAVQFDEMERIELKRDLCGAAEKEIARQDVAPPPRWGTDQERALLKGSHSSDEPTESASRARTTVIGAARDQIIVTRRLASGCRECVSSPFLAVVLKLARLPWARVLKEGITDPLAPIRSPESRRRCTPARDVGFAAPDDKVTLKLIVPIS